MVRKPLASVSLLCACVLLLLSFPAQAKEKQTFNSMYAPPFGSAPNARVENAVRFSLFNEYGEVENIAKPTFGGIFSLELAMEDSFSFELKTNLSSTRQKVVTYRCSDGTTVVQDSYDSTICGGEAVESSNFQATQVTIGLTPKYRFLNTDMFWGSFAIDFEIPLSKSYREGQVYELNPGLQFYFNLAQWFGMELDAAYLFNVVDPQAIGSDTTAAGEDVKEDRKLVHGAYARLNLLFRIVGVHFLGIQIEDTYYFHTMDSQRKEDIRQILRNQAGITSLKDQVDLRYYANHLLNIGGGYHWNVGFYEGGLGFFVAVTQRDRREQWGMTLDTRFTF